MIISHKYKFIFLKANRTASTSMELTLGQFLGPEDIITPLKRYRKNQDKLNIKYIKSSSLRPHASWKEVKKAITEEQGDSYFKFITERNPGDKVVSLYYYLKNRNEKRKEIEFKNFINSKKIYKCYNGNIYADGDKIKIDYICKYENLLEDLHYVEKIIGLNIVNYLTFNANSQFREINNYREMYDNKSEEIVKNCFKKEINYHNYKF